MGYKKDYTKGERAVLHAMHVIDLTNTSTTIERSRDRLRTLIPTSRSQNQRSSYEERDINEEEEKKEKLLQKFK